MPYDPELHRRRSTRVPSYDYRWPGHYFVTICTYQRLSLFDDPRLREIAEHQWRALARQASGVRLDEWIVMPNHVHGIIEIVSPHDAELKLPQHELGAPKNALGIGVAPGSLGAIVRTYKAHVSRRAKKLRDLALGPIWQRGYWERVVRDEQELNATRRYIVENPLRWAEDRDNLEALLYRMQAS
jgi:putative transposase